MRMEQQRNRLEAGFEEHKRQRSRDARDLRSHHKSQLGKLSEFKDWGKPYFLSPIKETTKPKRELQDPTLILSRTLRQQTLSDVAEESSHAAEDSLQNQYFSARNSLSQMTKQRALTSSLTLMKKMEQISEV